MIKRILLAIRLKLAGKKLEDYDMIAFHERQKGLKSFEAWNVIGNKWVVVAELLCISEDHREIWNFDEKTMKMFAGVDPDALSALKSYKDLMIEFI